MPLKCKTCRGQPSGREEVEEVEEESEVEPGRCIAPNCRTKAKIKKGAPFLICSRCQGHFHVQIKCSEMTRGQRGKIDESTWVCPICIEKESEQRTTEVEEESEVCIEKQKPKGEL